MVSLILEVSYYLVVNIELGRKELTMDDRLQVSARIKELKENCARLARIKENLTLRLTELNKTVDQLISKSHLSMNRPTMISRPPTSEAFRLKLASCLREMEPKAKEIYKMSEELHPVGLDQTELRLETR